MIGFALRCICILYLSGAELIIVERTYGLAPDIAVAWVCFAAFRLQPSSAWQILLPVAIARAVFFPGNIAVQIMFVLAAYLILMAIRTFIRASEACGPPTAGPTNSSSTKANLIRAGSRSASRAGGRIALVSAAASVSRP